MNDEALVDDATIRSRGQLDRSGLILILATLLWSGAVAFGFGVLMNHSATPGRSGVSESTWPATTHVPLDPRKYTLVMAIHPRCPCSRASIASLVEILTHCPDQIAVRLILYRPAEAASDWDENNLSPVLHALPGITLIWDADGWETRQFGAETSGHVLLYAPSGLLLFSGGITPMRGHAGFNSGEDAIISLVTDGKANLVQTPVYGCPIQTLNGSPCRKDAP